MQPEASARTPLSKKESDSAVNDRWPPTNDAPVSESVVIASLVHEAGPSAPNRRWTGRLVVLIVVLLVMGPILYAGLPHEIASWYAAAAFEKRLNGDFDGAFELLERGLTWDPEDASNYQLRADWKLARQDYPGCVADCERALELEPKNPGALTVRSQAFQHLGRHREAIADWDQIVKMYRGGSSNARATSLNGVAYAQAVGSIDLDKALDNIEQALRLVPSNAAMLDTRGYIRLLNGDLKEAKEDLDLAVGMVDEQLRKLEALTEYIDRREYLLTVQQERQGAAVIWYHRALLSDELGDSRQAEADRRRIRGLGFEPQAGLF